MARWHSTRPRAGVAALLAVSATLGIAGCAGGSADARGSSPTTTTAAASAKTSAGPTYRASAGAEDGRFALRVDKVIDPARASTPWGGEGTTSEHTHHVALDVTLRAKNRKGSGAVNGSCFSAKDSNGDKPERTPARTKKGKPIEGLMNPGSVLSGEVVFEVRDGARLAELTSSCGAEGKDSVTAKLLR